MQPAAALPCNVGAVRHGTSMALSPPRSGLTIAESHGLHPMPDFPFDLRLGRSGRFGPILPTATLVGYGIAIAAIVVMAVLSYSALRNNLGNAQRVTHTLRLVEQLQALLSTIKDAETGQRGFLLTGDEAYLEPYTNAKAALAGEIAAALDLVSADPEQQRRLQGLEQLCTDKMAELAQTVALR